ncbi:hypothetical protein Fcan01_07914 [Folsomia candida]|uniref:Uncharacterized protein n=1 Tax=Folsomia candida TaxID=158441 RepID=A0A226ENY8_FOLCA|nr:hypothetical protein Fcan01_07914 [Folsomia candida]
MSQRYTINGILKNDRLHFVSEDPAAMGSDPALPPHPIFNCFTPTTTNNSSLNMFCCSTPTPPPRRSSTEASILSQLGPISMGNLLEQRHHRGDSDVDNYNRISSSSNVALMEALVSTRGCSGSSPSTSIPSVYTPSAERHNMTTNSGKRKQRRYRAKFRKVEKVRPASPAPSLLSNTSVPVVQDILPAAPHSADSLLFQHGMHNNCSTATDSSRLMNSYLSFEAWPFLSASVANAMSSNLTPFTLSPPTNFLCHNNTDNPHPHSSFHPIHHGIDSSSVEELSPPFNNCNLSMGDKQELDNANDTNSTTTSLL